LGDLSEPRSKPGSLKLAKAWCKPLRKLRIERQALDVPAASRKGWFECASTRGPLKHLGR
jgi:hypothetical protein